MDSYLPHEKSKYDDSGKASYDKIDSNYDIDNSTGNRIPPPIKNLSGDGGAIIGNSSNNNSSKDAKSLAKLLLVDDDSDIVQVSSTSSPALLLLWLIM